MEDLNQKDLEILNVVSDNARLPYSSIAKIIKLSKDRVKIRLDNLVKKGYIRSFMPLIDYEKLGYKMFHAYIKIESSLEQEEMFLKKVISNNNVVAVTKTIGKCDYELQVLAKDVIDEYRILNDLFANFKKSITDLRVLTTIRYHKYTMAINHSNFQKGKANEKVQYTRKYSVDNKDLEILKVLSKDARLSLLEISEITKISPELVRYHINSLVRAGIIKKFYALTNKNSFGLTTYLLLLDIEGPILDKDIHFFNNCDNIYHARDTLGNWNLNIGFYAGTNKELFDTVHSIRKNFGSRLSRFDLLVPLQRYKFLPLPPAIKI